MAADVREMLEDADDSSATITLLTADTGPDVAQVGDLLVLVHAVSFYPVAQMLTPSGGGTWNGPVVIARDTTDNSTHIKVWWREVTSAGQQTVVANHQQSDCPQHAYALVIAGADTTAPFPAGSFAKVDDTFGGEQVAPSASGQDGGIRISLWVTDDVTSYDPVSGLLVVETDTGFSTALGGHADLSATGATGTITADADPARTCSIITVAVAPGAGGSQEGAGLASGVVLAPGAGVGGPAWSVAGDPASVVLTPGVGSGALFGVGEAASVVLTPGTGQSSVVIDALLDPSFWGWPDETNTGPSGTLTPSGSIITSSPGQIIEDLDITGSVEVVHNDVTIRNCRITAPDATGFPGNKAIIKQDSLTGLLVEDCELTCAGPGSYQSVIGDFHYTLRRCHVHDIPEGPRVGSGVVIEDCYIHSLIGNDPEAHSDTMQTTEGVGVRVHHNTIVSNNVDAGDATSAYICGPDLGDVEDLELTDNLLDGGGFTLYLGGSTFTINTVTVTGNRWGRAAVFGPISVDNISEVAGLNWSNNVFDDDNTALDLPGAGAGQPASIALTPAAGVGSPAVSAPGLAGVLLLVPQAGVGGPVVPQEGLRLSLATTIVPDLAVGTNVPSLATVTNVEGT